MNNLKVNHQKSSDKVWTDESGTKVQYSRTTKLERLCETTTNKLATKALKLNEALAEFKLQIQAEAEKVIDEARKEHKLKDGHKGNFTFTNFDRSIKVEVNVNERLEFDDITIKAAKERFDEFLQENITSKNEFAKEMIIDAFETQRTGKLDVKRVLQLTRHESKVKDKKFSEAVKLINQAIRRTDSKTYFRVWAKNSSGEYQNIDLNLSSI